MFVDAATPERAIFAGDFDVCVIGTGPAGITLARSLAAKGFRIALMEAGELEWSPESQGMYEGEVAGLDCGAPDGTRLRYFGGTSNHWNGLCRELDPYDFEPRAHHPMSGWPIGIGDLAPYRTETDRILDIAPRHSTPEPSGMRPDDPFRATNFLRSFTDNGPTRFAGKYHDELAASEAIVVGLHANLVDLRLEQESLGRVTHARFRSYAPDDPGFEVRARAFCLCAGGIENPRLLLNFRSQIPTGIGNEHDLVGRHFCDHASIVVGEMVFEEVPPSPVQFFSPSEGFLAKHEILNVTFRLAHRRRRAAPLWRETLREVQCAVPFAGRLLESAGVRPAFCDRGGLRAYWESRDPERYPWATVSITGEQALNPDSRVMLAEDEDALGLRRVRLDWRLSELDHHSLRAPTLAFAGYVADIGFGRIRLFDWVLEEAPALPSPESNVGGIYSYHHMCTTRMSDDPRQGVVNRDCRVHGVANLYVGGSSTFATTSYVNPTYTIVQLALRLADHLDGALHV